MTLTYIVCLFAATTAAYYGCKWLIFPYLTITYERHVIKSFLRTVYDGKLGMSEYSASKLAERLVANAKNLE